jgi:arginyl-tRNA synthetase
VNFSEFELIEKIRKSTAAIRRCEKELAKQEKHSAENQLLARRLGLDKNAEGEAVRASEEATVNSMRTKLAEMKVAHNKFVHEHGRPSELFPE